MEPAGLLSALRRHAPLVVGLTLLGIVIAAAVGTLLPRTYQARATLFLKVSAASTSLYERSQFALQRVQSYPQLLDSPSLLQSVVDTLGLHETSSALATQVTAENPTSTVLLNITASAPTPQGAADIANAASDALAKNVNSLENDETSSKNTVALVPEITAEAPKSPSSPNLPVLLGLGLVAGFVIGALVALLLERVRPRVRTVADVRRVTGLPVIAQLPRSTRHRPAATANAAVNLRAITRGQVPRALLLTPVDERANRAGTHLLLAWGLAQTGRRVLAITAAGDPVGQFGIQDRPDAAGLSEVLAGRTSVDDATTQAGELGFDVLPSGDLAVAPSGFALEQRGASGLAPLFTGHDVTVLQATLDSRPLSLETAGAATRSTVLVVGRGATEHDLRLVAAQVRALDLVPIGVVMTDMTSVSDDLVETWGEGDFLRAVAEPLPAAGSARSGESDVVEVAPR